MLFPNTLLSQNIIFLLSNYGKDKHIYIKIDRTPLKMGINSFQKV